MQRHATIFKFYGKSYCPVRGVGRKFVFALASNSIFLPVSAAINVKLLPRVIGTPVESLCVTFERTVSGEQPDGAEVLVLLSVVISFVSRAASLTS